MATTVYERKVSVVKRTLTSSTSRKAYANLLTNQTGALPTTHWKLAVPFVMENYHSQTVKLGYMGKRLRNTQTTSNLNMYLVV